jgi:hypothetical protein
MKNSITNRESIKIYSEEKKIVIYVFYKIPKLDKTVSSWKKTAKSASSSDMDEIRWSKWLESMWKDVECTVGILKGRWRILKSGIWIQGVDAVDNIWRT